MKKYKVQILMSTYNGEKFIKKQLDSIINQDYEVSLFIRDDGSSDKTVEIIKEYEKRYNFISHIEAENIGVIHSFFELFRLADKEADFYALSDQDDVWFNDKITNSLKIVSRMSKQKPGLYCSSQVLIDAHDNVLDVNMKEVHIRPGFGNAIIENIATGCTCMFNKKMLDIVSAYEPEYTIMHDWWLYMIAQSMGEFYYDNNPQMYYRQHGNNTMGSRTNYLDEFKERFKRFSGNKGKLYNQMWSFKKGYVLTGSNADVLDMVLSYRCSLSSRIRCIFSKKIYRQRKLDNLIFKILFLMNHI